MDENHPKRRKDKYNPYTIGTTDDGRHWLTFSDGQGIRHHTSYVTLISPICFMQE